MATYLLLYNGGSLPADEAEQKAALKEWETWYNVLGSAVVDPGNPFIDDARSVSSEGRISNGPVGVMASGYTIIRAESLDAAAMLAKSCPILKGGAKITVYETFDARGM
jgi:hypothetical protein